MNNYYYLDNERYVSDQLNQSKNVMFKLEE